MPEDNEQPSPIDPLTIGELIPITEAAKIINLNPAFLRQISGKGRLKAKKQGRDWFTTLAALDEYVRSRHRGKKLDIWQTCFKVLNFSGIEIE